MVSPATARKVSTTRQISQLRAESSFHWLSVSENAH
ncbi:hypothetical protein F442_03719 [Phytophthora nicotianae P10297]|uniref:Uncharacterized protein n=1 Tax=Phytophthora nicotianae P10297 TaxID=1317064 RepID=W2ZVQ9_PHYNI|nr:hypothetical protein F442_03719 [Phytophthora nicotianae P10297]